MGIKLNDAADAVAWLWDEAWKATDDRRPKRAARLEFCADLIGHMQEELADAEEACEILMDLPTPDQLRLCALQAAQRRLMMALGPPDRISMAEVAYDVIDEMIEQAELGVMDDMRAGRAFG